MKRVLVGLLLGVTAMLGLTAPALAGDVHEMQRLWTKVIVAASRGAGTTSQIPMVRIAPDNLEINVEYNEQINQGMPMIMIAPCVATAGIAEQASADFSLWTIRVKATDSTGERRKAQMKAADCSVVFEMAKNGDQDGCARYLISHMRVN